jgi:hypothetical protein
MKWVTREKVRVNRTATAWLIRRFVDPNAELIFVPAEHIAEVQRERGATGFDAPGATYPHKDENGRCSFAAFVSERFADNPVLMEMARIVQAADFRDELDTHPAARGLALISHGFPLVTNNDDETVARASFLYDALYESLEEGRIAAREESPTSGRRQAGTPSNAAAQ